MPLQGLGFGAAQGLEKVLERRYQQQQLEALIASREAALAESQRSSKADEAYRNRSLDVQQQRWAAQDAATQRELERTQGRQTYEDALPGRVDPAQARLIQKDPASAALLTQSMSLPEQEGVGPLPEMETQRPERYNERLQRITGERLAEGQRLGEVERQEDRAARDRAFNEQRRQFGVTTAATAEDRRERRENRPATGIERQTFGFYKRMDDALKNMDAVEKELTDQDLALMNNSPLPDLVNNVMMSKAGQLYAQALTTYTEARLRKESGAGIPLTEYATDRKTIGRQVGDQPETIQQKRKTRERTAKGIAFASGPAYKEYYGEPLNLKDDDDAGGGDPLVVNGIRFPSADAAAAYKREKGIQ